MPRKEVVKMMLFLGAGASKPFGIKTMEELSRELENNLEPIKDKIKTIEGEFGEEEVFKDLKQRI
jgi:hypothetical protein